MFTVYIKETSTSSAVAVSRLSDLEQAISFGFQLHQVSSCKHYIVVKDDDVVVATFVRQNSFQVPNAKPQDVDKPQAPKSLFGLRKKN